MCRIYNIKSGLIASLSVGVIPCAVQREAVLCRHGIVKGAGTRNDPVSAQRHFMPRAAHGTTGGNYSTGFCIKQAPKLIEIILDGCTAESDADGRCPRFRGFQTRARSRGGHLKPIIRNPVDRFARRRHPGNAEGVIRDRCKCRRLLRSRIARKCPSGMTRLRTIQAETVLRKRTSGAVS